MANRAALEIRATCDTNGWDRLTLRLGLVILVAILAIAFSCVAGLLFRWRRRAREQSGEHVPPTVAPRTSRLSKVKKAPRTTNDDDVLSTVAWAIIDAQPANPLALLGGLRLNDAIDARRYGDAVTSFVAGEHQIDVTVAGSAVSVVTNLREVAQSGTHLTFELSSSIQAGLARGTLRLGRDRNGRLLATVQDTQTGKITELLRGAPSGIRLGAVMATVYGLAHLVSAQDLATKLDVLAKKVDVLVALRTIDQRAQLEAAFARAKELGMRPIDDSGRAELRELRHEVRALRYVWRGEVLHALTALRDPPSVNRFNSRLPRTTAKHAAMQEGLRAAAGQVALMEFSLRFEHLLAVAGGDAEPFLRMLPEELDEWDELGAAMAAKASTIGYEALTAQPYVDAVREVAHVYRVGVEREPEDATAKLN